jgi:ORF6N domain
MLYCSGAGWFVDVQGAIINPSQMSGKTLPAEHLPVPLPVVERRIHEVRGRNVMLDRDLAGLYGVKAIALRQQVKRNKRCFPGDFMFQLTAGEAGVLVSQNVIPSRRSLGGSLPYVFTQEGVAMSKPSAACLNPLLNPGVASVSTFPAKSNRIESLSAPPRTACPPGAAYRCP